MTLTTLFGTTTPLVIDSADGSPYTLGVDFTSSVDGRINAFRFYKAAANTGTHVGYIFDDVGDFLYKQTFVGETASGWQEQALDRPFTITANRTYVVAVTFPNGHFSIDAGFWTGGNWTSGTLTAPKSSSVGDNGRAGSGIDVYPNTTAGNSNYWADFVFEDVAAPSTNTTLMSPDSIPNTIDSNDTGGVNLAVVMQASVNGIITAIRFYKSVANGGTHTGVIRDLAGTALSTEVFTGETGSGWQQQALSSPVAITAGTYYKICVHCPTGHYSRTQNMFTTYNFLAPPLGSYITGTGGTSNGLYDYSASVINPTSTFQATYYWIDAVFSFGGAGKNVMLMGFG